MNQEESDFWAEVARLTPVIPEVTIEYRWHYNASGRITMCSMCDHPPSENHIVVDEALYHDYFQYRIVDGKPVKIVADSGHRKQLISSDHGYAVVKNHANLLLEPNETFNELEYYDRNS
jgi:hypothetical protein